MNSGGGGNWKGLYGYDAKHSTYSTQYKPRKTETGVGVGTGQLSFKKCGIMKPDRDRTMAGDKSQQCTSGTCPWR